MSDLEIGLIVYLLIGGMFAYGAADRWQQMLKTYPHRKLQGGVMFAIILQKVLAWPSDIVLMLSGATDVWKKE